MAQVNNQAQTNLPVLIQSMQDAQTCLTQMTQAIFALGLTLGTCQNHLSLSMSKALDCNDHSAPIKAEPASDERSSHMDPLFLQSELQQCRTLNRSLHERIIELELQLEDKMSVRINWSHESSIVVSD